MDGGKCRAATFCALKKYSDALKDAEEIVKINPAWPKVSREFGVECGGGRRKGC